MRRCLLILILVVQTHAVLAQRIAPARVQVSMFAKLLPFYTNLGKDPFTIHVVDTPAVAKEIQKIVGTKIGHATLDGVTSGNELPATPPKVIYLAKFDESIASYARENKILTITGNPASIKEGLTLCVGMERGKAKILLNLTTTKLEGVLWNPAILRVSTQVR